MKQSLLILILFISLSCNAPKQFMQDVNFSEIVDAPGISRVQLYSDINSWMAERFVSRDNVIQFDDKETGKIIGRFIVEFSESNERYMTLNFDIKDESFKMAMKGSVNTYEFKDDTGKWFTNDNPYYKYNPDEVPLIKEKWNDYLSDVVSYINSIDENW